MQRWTNIRDAFAKFSKKEKEKRKYGTRPFKHKKYIYSDKLNFLKKLYITRDVEDDFEKDNGKIYNSEVEDDIYHKEESTRANRIKKTDQNLGSSSKKRHKSDKLEQIMLKAFQNEMLNRHSYFFNGIIPALEKFNEDEVLKFQMGALQLISNINDEKRKFTQPFNCTEPDIHSSQPTASTYRPFNVVPQGQPPQKVGYPYYQNLNQPAASTSIAPLLILQPIYNHPQAQSTSSPYNSVDYSTSCPT